MLRILGLNGSPRKKSNTAFLLSCFLQEARKMGAEVETIDVCSRNILPCDELIVCEKKGFCPIKDDMKDEIYSDLREADVIILSTPIFFFNMTAQLKALVDRCQLYWARKYKLNLTDPRKSFRRGFVLSAGASKGKNLFDGLELTAKYFFDALDMKQCGGLYYPKIESIGAMEKHPTVMDDVKKATEEVIGPLLNRPTVLFVGRFGNSLVQMATAFMELETKGRIRVLCSGMDPGKSLDPMMEKAMAEIGHDVAFRRIYSFSDLIRTQKPSQVITLGFTPEKLNLPNDIEATQWDLDLELLENDNGIYTLRKKIQQLVQKFCKIHYPSLL
ncbi:flavodoxin family protein [Desulfobacterales bacterium HSG17]|nr:flavodoxin family protein [Desulfobacterales bacterium HSG17]